MEVHNSQSPRRPRKTLAEIKTTDIPSVTELQQDLGFGGKSDVDKAFRRSVKKHIESFTTEDNIPGHTFTRWRDPSDKMAFSDMARSFLDAEGPLMWRDDANTENAHSYRFSRDYEQLLDLLAQLFFRKNEHHKRAMSNKLDSPLGLRATNVNRPQDHLSHTVNTAVPDNSNFDDHLAGIRHDGATVHDTGSPPTPHVSPRLEDYGWSRRDLLLNASPNQESSSILGNTCRAQQTAAASSSREDPVQRPNQHRHVERECVLVEDSSSSDESIPAIVDRGKRPAAARPDENNRPAKAPRHERGQPRDPDSRVADDSTLMSPREKAIIGSTEKRPRQTVHREDYVTGNEALALYRVMGKEDKQEARKHRRVLSPKKKKNRRPRASNVSGGRSGLRPHAAPERDAPSSPTAPVATMVLESIERYNATDLSGINADFNPGESVGEGDVGDAVEEVAPKLSRTPTPEILQNPGDLGEVNFLTASNSPQLGDEPRFEPDITIERGQPLGYQEELLQVETERSHSLQDSVQGGSPTSDELQVHSDPGARDTATRTYNVDYTVYDDNRELVPDWKPPRDFLDMSFDGLFEALPLRQPRGLRLRLEESGWHFSRTARDEAKFRWLQNRFRWMMNDVRQKALAKGVVPNFEIIIEPLQ
ncbi:hypothetical protein FALBO_3112 [Fusarium albosuccineum]|uniref:Uncharacterized protein n=1 Tax=Fusarium albosuccineum TaxID=1237068 RepID=A0A8H4LLE2_9HYPO|nr:hypothetical protein FALBO_3112 [Fusarium albosuccineum]